MTTRPFLPLIAACVLICIAPQALAQTCSYSLNPTTEAHPPDGYLTPDYFGGLVMIDTAAGCPWAATTADSWIQMMPPSSGTGFGILPYTVSPNPGSTSRTGAITIAGQKHTVIQAGHVSGCTYSLAPKSASISSAAQNINVSVSTGSGCYWSVNASVAWISYQTYPSGIGSGTMVIAVGANASTSSRTSTVTIAGQPFPVTQAGTGPSCTYSILPTSASVGAAATTGSVSVTASSGCSWTASSNASWIRVTSGASGSGNGTVQYSVDTNTGTSVRSGTLTIAGQTFTVNQAGSSPGVTPLISSGGVVNGADLTPNFAPGGVITIFGSDLAATTVIAPGGDLPLSLGGVSVEVVDGNKTLSAPLYFVSAGQINAQLPFEVNATGLSIRVRRGQSVSNEQSITWQARNPRLFTIPPGGTGTAAIIHNDGKGTLVSESAPGQPGEVVTVYLTGLGATTPAATTGKMGGDGAGLGPLNEVNTDVTITIGGQTAKLQWAGLAPYYVGLYQVNFYVPEYVTAATLEVKVSAESHESQANATMVCGGGWQPLASANIGASGGTVSGGGLTLTVPGGAFSGANSVKVMRNTSEEPEENQTGDTFGITGLPETTAAAVTVSVDLPTPPSDPTKVYLVVSEASAGGGELFLKATVQGNHVTATLPQRALGLRAQAANSSLEPTVSAAHPRADESLTSLLVLYVIYDMDTYQSPGGNLLFLFSQKLGIQSKVTQLGALADPKDGSLNSFVAQVGFAAAWQEAKPVLVYPRTSATRAAWSPGAVYDAEGVAAMTLVSLRDNWSSSYISIWNPVGRTVDVLHWVLTHELAHVLQDQAAAPSQEELAFTDRSWLGTQESIAWAVGCKRFPDMTNVACIRTPEAEGLYNLKRLATLGLGYSWDSANHRVFDLAIAESNFLTYSADNFAISQRWAILGGIATQRGIGSNRVLPVDAINRVLAIPPLDVGDAWLGFWKYVALRVGLPSLSTMFDFVKNTGSVLKFGASDVDRTLVWHGSADLTMNFYEVDFPSPWPWEEERPLTISATATGEGRSPIVVVINTTMDGQLQIVATGTSVKLTNLRDLAATTRGRLYVMVINPNAVTPYDNRADITLRLAFETTGTLFSEMAQAAQAGKLTMEVSIENGNNWWHIDNLTGWTGSWSTSPHLAVTVAGSSLVSSGTKPFDLSSGCGTEVVSLQLNFSADGNTLTGATAKSDCTRQDTSGGKTVTTESITTLTVKKAIPLSFVGGGEQGDDFKSYNYFVQGTQIKDYLDAVNVLKVTGKPDVTTTMTTFSSGANLAVPLYRPFP